MPTASELAWGRKAAKPTTPAARTIAAGAAPISGSASEAAWAQPGMGERVGDFLAQQAEAPEGQGALEALGRGLTRQLPNLGSILGAAGGTALGAGGGTLAAPGPGTAAGAVLGGTGGAAAGGMAGRAAQQAIEQAMGWAPVPQTPEEALANVGQQAAEAGWQGATHGTGLALQAGAKGAGKLLMSSGLRANPRVAQTAIEEGITVTPMGYRKVKNLLGEIGKETGKILTRATIVGQRAAGRANVRVQFSPYEVIQRVEAKLGDLLPSEQDAVKPMIDRFLRDYVGPRAGAGLTPSALKDFAQKANELGEPVIRGLRRGVPTKFVGITRARWYKAAYEAARDLLHETFPEVGALDARASRLIELQQTLFPHIKRGLPIGAQIARPTAMAAAGGAVGAALPAQSGKERLVHTAAGLAAGSPYGLSTLSLLLSNPTLGRILLGLPRAGSAMQAGQ